jgi:hypothetical protein
VAEAFVDEGEDFDHSDILTWTVLPCPVFT